MLYDKALEGFKERDAVKNVWYGVARALEFVPNGNYFYFFAIFSKWVL